MAPAATAGPSSRVTGSPRWLDRDQAFGAARRTPAHRRVGEPGRTRRAGTGCRCVSRSAHLLAFFFFVDVEEAEEEEGVALAEALGVGAGLGAMAVAPLAVNP